jgi:two-component system, LytTR family, sensor kinase
MSRFRKYYRLRVLGHIVFWLAGISFMILELYVVSRETFKFDFITLAKATIPVVCFAFAVYTNLYLLIPKFLKPKNYIFYVFWLILLMASTSVLIQFLFIVPFNNLLPPDNKLSFFNPDMYSRYFFATFLYIGLTSFLKFVKDWIVLQDLKLKYEQSERQKLEAELKTLKGQIHPHFLFNSLNNIYSLSLTNSEKVPELILKLSDLMRHIIYESRENFICLSKELEFVDNYISLQKIRVSDKVKIDYNIVGTVPDKRIAPLLFEPFIDNAFKHGLNGSGKGEYVSVLFDFTDPKILAFSIENSYEKSFFVETKYKGIGLENVKQRLKHLYSENEYQLNISANDNTFRIDLKLDLKD